MDRPPETVLDELLVLRAQGGDAQALTDLVRRWQRPLHRHALHLTGHEDVAADVVQETWLAVARGIRRLQDPACFPRWVFQIASRKCADWVRGQQRQRDLAKQRTDSAIAERSDEDRSDDVARLREGLKRLPGDRRALLAMCYLDGMSIAAIAQALGVPSGTVKSRLHHARQELKQLLERSQT